MFCSVLLCCKTLLKSLILKQNSPGEQDGGRPGLPPGYYDHILYLSAALNAETLVSSYWILYEVQSYAG